MPVLNIAANQVQSTPVSSFYEGKAVRLAQKNAEIMGRGAELDNELKEQALEGPTAADQEKAQLELDNLRTQVEKRRQEIGDAEMKRRANAYGPVIEEATRMSEAGDLDGAIEFANRELRAAAQGLGEEAAAEFQSALGDDGVLDKEEISRMKYGIQAYYEMEGDEGPKDPEYKAKDTYVGDDGKEYHGWYDDKGNFNKTDVLAKTDDGEKTTFSPPNSNEIEAAEAIVDQDEVLDDLSSKQKRVAAQMIATEIKQLQRSLGWSYDEAADAATSRVKKMTKEEKSRLWGSNTVLDMSTGGLKSNQYKGPDGHIYEDTGDGFVRVD